MKSKKKTAAQLNREIAQALRSAGGTRSRPVTNKTGFRKPVRHHAVAKEDDRQEDFLLVANDAALGGQYERATKLLSQGKQRAIATAFTTVTEESSTAGDYASRGWEDQKGADIEVDALDIEEEEVDAGSHAPVTDAIVKKAVSWLNDHGATSTSSSRFHPGTWYETELAMDYSSGEEKQEEFFLRNFTAHEEKLVFEAFNK